MDVSGVQLMQCSNCNVSGFSPDNFSRLEKIMYPRQVAEGSYLFWEGDLANKLFYVKSGQIKISKSTEDGKEFILYILQKGDLFGEIGGHDEVRYSFNAKVIKDATVGVIQQSDLEILVYQHGDFAVEFMKWMGLMHRTTQSKFRDLMLFGKPGALASTLIRLCNSYGEQEGNGIRIKIKLTNTELANFIGTTRESVNRLLSSYKDEGVLSFDHGQIVVHNLAFLRKVANCPSCPACSSEICRI